MRMPRFQYIGYWSWTADPVQLVEPSWASGERPALVTYLQSGIRLLQWRGYSFCRFQCGIPRQHMGSADFTDGRWIWPEGLWHYVAEHMIALPDAFLAHARMNGFSVPAPDSLSLPHKGVGSSALKSMSSESIWHEWIEQRSRRIMQPPNEEL